MADVSAILGTGPAPQQPSPLDTLSKWQALTNAQTQNESTQQQILNQKQELENLKLTNKTGQQSLEQKMHAQTQQDLFSIRNLPDDQIVAGALKKLDERLANGLIDQQTYGVQKQGIMNYANDPKGLRARIDTGIVNAMTASEAVKNYAGENKEVETGQGVQGYTQSGQLTPTPGVLKPVGGIIGTGAPSNADLSNTVQITDDRRWLEDGSENPHYGQLRTVVKGQVVPPGLQRPGPPGPLPPIPGVTPPAPGATPPAPGATPPAPGATPPAPGATPPAPGATPPAPGATPPAPGATPPAPGVPVRPTVSGSPGVAVNLPPGVKESLEADRAASTQQGIALTNTDAGRAQKFALLDDIITQAKVPGAFSGPDQPGFIQTMARLAQVPGVITDDVKRTVGAQEQMTKAMANLQSILMDSMISTNAGLAHTIDASPHPQLSEYGLSGIVHQLQGTYDAQEAMSNAWQNSGRPAYEFKDWQRQFLARTKDGQFDPRVFWLARMNDQERKTFYKASNNDPALKKNYNYAVKNGWIDHESTQ